jgi:hypothetical protein
VLPRAEEEEGKKNTREEEEEEIPNIPFWTLFVLSLELA